MIFKNLKFIIYHIIFIVTIFFILIFYFYLSQPLYEFLKNDNIKQDNNLVKIEQFDNHLIQLQNKKFDDQKIENIYKILYLKFYKKIVEKEKKNEILKIIPKKNIDHCMKNSVIKYIISINDKKYTKINNKEYKINDVFKECKIEDIQNNKILLVLDGDKKWFYLK